MTLTPGQQAALYTISLVLVAVGALGTAAATTYGLPPIAGLVIIVLGIAGTAIIKGYGLGQQVALKAQISALLARPPSSSAPDTTKQ